ncbi:MAG TPA: hypothetical protein ENG95_04350 [Nitrospirae bacterium]|nr:hypothetical protein [Nitrospirota bacterium]
MKNWFLKRILEWIAKKFDGKKTVIGGIGLILLGIVHIVGIAYPDLGLPVSTIEVALTEISGGFAVLGLGGKLEKIKKIAVEKGGSKK